MRAVETLREGLLEGVSVLVAGRPVQADAPGAAAAAAVAACAELGARVFSHPSSTDEATIDETVQARVAETGGIDLLVFDGASLFAAESASGARPKGGGRGAELDRRACLRACLDTAWSVTRAVVNLAFLPGERGGRIVYIAPAPGAGEHADAARAGLENLSRTLSIEWARHGITTVTITLGDDTSAGEAGAIVAYLASPAGAYFSGCLLDLRGVSG